MTPSLVRIEPFTVAGLTVRTTNEREAHPASAVLPNLWAQFYNEGVADRVARAPDASPVAVYWQYDSDASGAYNVTVGVELRTPRVLASDITVIEVAGGDYVMFRETGELPGAVVTGWRRVWEYFQGPTIYRRAFTTDFERYDAPGEVAIHIAVRPLHLPPPAP
jgi:predicted transcriptional regulator YdeE